jgi:hypothetical protein
MTVIERLARLGYIAIGIVYALIGGLTAAAALHHKRGAADRRDAFAFILDKPFGNLLLIVIAAGLAGYAIWRISSGIVDSERRGSDAKGFALRAGSIARGLFYGGAAWQVVHLAMREGGQGRGSDANAKHWTARAMDHPFGRWAVAIAGLVIVGAGIYQISRAVRGKLSSRLHLQSRRLIAISRFGIAARGVVFGIIGASLVLAAIHYDASEARGTTGAFHAVAQQPFGRVLLALVATGFIAYGVYAVVNGLYRDIRAS